MDAAKKHPRSQFFSQTTGKNSSRPKINSDLFFDDIFAATDNAQVNANKKLKMDQMFESDSLLAMRAPVSLPDMKKPKQADVPEDKIEDDDDDDDCNNNNNNNDDDDDDVDQDKLSQECDINAKQGRYGTKATRMKKLYTYNRKLETIFSKMHEITGANYYAVVSPNELDQNKDRSKIYTFSSKDTSLVFANKVARAEMCKALELVVPGFEDRKRSGQVRGYLTNSDPIPTAVVNVTMNQLQMIQSLAHCSDNLIKKMKKSKKPDVDMVGDSRF